MENYFVFNTTDNLVLDIKSYFLKYDRLCTYEHTLDVINELYDIKAYFGQIEQGSLIAAYCHDLGRVVKNDEILEFCYKNNIAILDEEKKLPSILHQKISCLLAEKVFKISDITILNAIRYHTTSRKTPSMTEIEVFLADKMSWKEEGYRELSLKIKEAIKKSKEEAVYYYLSSIHNNRDNIELYHSDSKEAFEYFNQVILKDIIRS